jgi:hypothetical protein
MNFCLEMRPVVVGFIVGYCVGVRDVGREFYCESSALHDISCDTDAKEWTWYRIIGEVESIACGS